MVGYGYGYITIITIITILTNNRITILKMVKMVMSLQKMTIFFSKRCYIKEDVFKKKLYNHYNHFKHNHYNH